MGKICQKFPENTTTIPPNDESLLCIYLNVRSTNSIANLVTAGASFHASNFVSLINSGKVRLITNGTCICFFQIQWYFEF